MTPNLASSSLDHGFHHLLLGQLLQQAGIISWDELQTALQAQKREEYKGHRLGEVLVVMGLVSPETLEFFASRFQEVMAEAQAHPHERKIGDYLQEAHLLSPEQVEEILEEQGYKNELFGNLAVKKKFIKQQTLNFFVEHLSKEKPVQARINQHMINVKSYLKLNNIKGAILELREAIKLDPHSHKFHAWLAQIYLEEKLTSIAQIHLRKALQANPMDPFVQSVSNNFSVSYPTHFQSFNQDLNQNFPPKQKAPDTSWVELSIS